jgi:Arm DNA-binding domain/Phage integrase family
MTQKRLTDRGLKALKPAVKGTHYDVWDIGFAGFGVRVSDTGRRTFVLAARYPGKSNPTRRALGTYGKLSLHDAKEKARDWLKLLEKGVDPADAEEQERRAAIRKQENTFLAVAENFIADKLPGERRGKEVERDIRRDLIPPWGKRPLTEITARDIRDLTKAKSRTAPAQARNLLGVIKRLFGWAVEQDCYGLVASPADALKPSKIIGDKIIGQRILSDAELFALWRAARRTPYPYGPVYHLLILSALRLNEAADASNPEFDFSQRLWTIPAERMKGKNGKARPHVVPLTDEILAILEKLPRFKNGKYLFSTTSGVLPVWMSDKVKKRIDERMLRTLRALARRRGDDPRKVELPHWTNHDIRRTVRSGLSRLKIAEETREAVLAHVRPGIKGTYDHYDYLDEKRDALKQWAARLRDLIEPPTSNVVQLAARA